MAMPRHPSSCDLSSEWRHANILVWTIVAAVAFIVALVPLFTAFQFALPTFTLPLMAFPALMAGAWFYRRYRKDERLASALECTAQIGAFTAFAAPLSYIAASANQPLQDGLLDSIDRAMGFDWLALLDWMNAHPGIQLALTVAYRSFLPQATITVAALAFSCNLLRLRIFMLAFMLATLLTIAISALLPAEGIWGFYKEAAAHHPAIVTATHGEWLPHYAGLRDGSFRTLMARGSDGIISFPSLHAALAVIFMLALWPIRYLRWLGLIVNLPMIAATPIEGGHYFVDVIAGLAIAVACWVAANRLARRGADLATIPQSRPDLVPCE